MNGLQIIATELNKGHQHAQCVIFTNFSVYLSLFLQPTHLANFNQVQSIQYSALEEKDRKGMLQLNVAGAPEVKTHTHLTDYSLGFPL